MMEASPEKSEPTASAEDYHNLEEAVVTAVELVPSPAQACIEVVAPIALPGGYPLDVEINGQLLTVLVPKGGVPEGQRFTALALPKGVTNPSMSIPTGAWRDGLCDCCVYGCCHELICLAIWCAPVALAQVMTRMNLNWHGGVASVNPGMMSTFKTVLFIWILFLTVDHGLSVVYNAYLAPMQRNKSNSSELPVILFVTMATRAAWHVLFFMYLILATMKTREYIRNKYSIPEQNCAGCEDGCCSLLCSCCTITQMARHTADYDTYRAAACSETGLPRNAPVIM